MSSRETQSVAESASTTPATTVLDELVNMLALEKIELNLFRGQSVDPGWGTVFGGHVLGQALSAAAQTVPVERPVHSLQAYFLRPGDVTRPILYEVDRIRDGGSFTTRRVVAIQNGHPIFNVAASFQADEEGFTHQDAMPEVPPPEALKSDQELVLERASELPEIFVKRALAPRPFEMRMVTPEPPTFTPTARPPRRLVWLRTVHALPDNDALHRYMLAYASDFMFVTTALLPHGVGWLTPGMQIASLDHVMYFHRPLRVDDWLLYVMESPAASGGRGLARGELFSRDGKLVASTIQEGLIRRRK